MATWHAKPWGSYLRGSTEGDENAKLICSWLMRQYGWSFVACCGMLGNIAAEGGLNPWQYEISWTNTLGRLPTQAEAASINGKGMGLIGWTPCRKYTVSGNSYWPQINISAIPGYGPNFYDKAGNTNDGHAQTDLIGRLMASGNSNFWINRKGCTASQYIKLNHTDDAAYYWMWNAEYPADRSDSAVAYRRRMASEWFYHLGGNDFVPIDDPVEGSGGEGDFPLALLFKSMIDHMNGRC